jgi:hypothetical protein
MATIIADDHRYSITSSARASSDGGTSRPRVLAFFSSLAKIDYIAFLFLKPRLLIVADFW